MSFSNNNHNPHSPPILEESTEQNEAAIIQEQEFEEYQHNVEDLEKMLMIRKQQHVEWNLQDFNGSKFDLNMYIGLEKAPIEKSPEALTFFRRMDNLIQDQLLQGGKIQLDDIRKVLPVFTRRDTLPPTRVPLLVSIQFSSNGSMCCVVVVAIRYSLFIGVCRVAFFGTFFWGKKLCVFSRVCLCVVSVGGRAFELGDEAIFWLYGWRAKISVDVYGSVPFFFNQEKFGFLA